MNDKDTRATPESLLTPQDFTAIVQATENTRDRALIYVLFEGALRPGELLTMTLSSIVFKTDHCLITVNGKTGIKRIPLIVAYQPLLLWVADHPQRANPQAPLWCSLANNHKGERLSYTHFRLIIKKLAKKILRIEQAEAAIDETCKGTKTYRDYAKYLFYAGRTTVVCTIIKSLEIEIHNDTYDEDLTKLFSTQLIPKEYADVLLTYMLGWITQRVESFTKDGKPAYVKAEEYREVLTAQIKACNDNTNLQALSTVPTEAQTAVEVEKLGIYIKQLKLIEAVESELFEAASDFIRMKNEKIEWAKRGIVTDQSFNDYHDALYRTWKNQTTLMSLNHKSNLVECGKAIYAQCMNDSGKQKLQGAQTPSFFGSGSLHGLANDPPELPRIGWHPQYKDLLRKNRP